MAFSGSHHNWVPLVTRQSRQRCYEELEQKRAVFSGENDDSRWVNEASTKVTIRRQVLA